MEISEGELRELLHAVDDQHRDGMRGAADQLAALHAETRRFRRPTGPRAADRAAAGAPRGGRTTTRRAFLARAGVGTAGLLAVNGGGLPLLTGRAAAQEAEEPDDASIAAFAESLELAAAEAYGAAAAGGKLSAPMAATVNLFASHHREHATAFASVAGSAATGRANAGLVRTLGDQLRNAHDEEAVLQIAFDLEEAAAATYLYALGVLDAKAARELAASILPVESQHAVVLGRAMGKELGQVVPSFENLDKAIDLAKFPVTTTTTTTTTTK